MCMKPQKQQKNIIHSDIRNILNPVSILFWTRIVTLPSVDSRVTSVNQPLTPTSSSVLYLEWRGLIEIEISLRRTTPSTPVMQILYR